MNVPFLEAIDNEPHVQTAFGDEGGFDRRGGLVHFGASIARLINISVGFHFIGARRAGGGGINRLGKSKLEAVGAGAHLAYFEGGLAGPNQTLQGIRFAAARTPAAVGSLNEQGTIRSHFKGEVSGIEALPQHEASALVTAP